MSIHTQQRLAMRMTVAMALMVAASLLIVGWTLYKPGPAPSPLESAAQR
ncbi:MAG: hypothetical protein JST54_14175 [Deltaproteobacteria bacterium]|nr:hypothetical protein [Deltaproteobacteria bacterium]